MDFPDKTFTLIGISETLSYSGDNYFGFELMPQYEVVFKLAGDYYTYKITFEVTYGSCCSGYCAATYGDYSEVIKIEDSLPPIHYTPLESTQCHFVENSEGRVIIELVDGVGNVLLHYFCDLDRYYPTDSLTLNKEYFKQSIRVSSKHITYVLVGSSGLGKSYLGYFLGKNLKVYETDCLDSLPYNLITYDVIVVGNKHPEITYEEVVSALKDYEDNKIVKVNLTLE